MHKIRVLFVDDNRIFLETLFRSFRRVCDLEVIQVGVAGSGRDAVAMAARLKPDLVLMDLVMPRMNGLTATRLIKMANPEVRVVIMTVHDSKEYESAATSAGADGFVAKSELIARLGPLVERLFRCEGRSLST